MNYSKKGDLMENGEIIAQVFRHSGLWYAHICYTRSYGWYKTKREAKKAIVDFLSEMNKG